MVWWVENIRALNSTASILSLRKAAKQFPTTFCLFWDCEWRWMSGPPNPWYMVHSQKPRFCSKTSLDRSRTSSKAWSCSPSQFFSSYIVRAVPPTSEADQCGGRPRNSAFVSTPEVGGIRRLYLVAGRPYRSGCWIGSAICCQEP